jgi:GTP-binding protein
MSTLKKLKTILIIGRPNVGKSTLINRILESPRAITQDTPGVTRDVVRYMASFKGRPFSLLDSAGVFFDLSDTGFLQPEIEARVDEAIQEADGIVWVTDGAFGVHPVEEAIAQRLRPVSSRVVIAANKCDNDMIGHASNAFYELGFPEVLPISALHGLGVEALLRTVLGNTLSKGEDNSEWPRIAVMGRPNVGKSSLLNALTGRSLALVHNAPGTTRDPIECPIVIDDKPYILIDTAGLRRQAKMEDDIEYYSSIRATGVLTRADVAVVVIDATDFLVDQDKRVLQLVLESQKPFVLFVNKWDQTDRSHETRQRLLEEAHRLFPSLAYFPTIFGSATSAIHLSQLKQRLHALVAQRHFRAPTPEVNRFIQDVLRRLQPPTMSGGALTIYFGTQTTSSPMQFVFSVNRTKGIPEAYTRFLERRLRAHFPELEGQSVEIVFKSHRGDPDATAAPRRRKIRKAK